MRAVQTKYSLLVHLFPDSGSKTFCGVIPYGKAPAIIHRLQLCKNCFKHNGGVDSWTASQLGVEKIYEDKK